LIYPNFLPGHEAGVVTNISKILTRKIFQKIFDHSHFKKGLTANFFKKSLIKNLLRKGLIKNGVTFGFESLISKTLSA
jgi:hypothetical protein